MFALAAYAAVDAIRRRPSCSIFIPSVFALSFGRLVLGGNHPPAAAAAVACAQPGDTDAAIYMANMT